MGQREWEWRKMKVRGELSVLGIYKCMRGCVSLLKCVIH